MPSGSFNIEKIHLKEIELQKLVNWIDQLDQYLNNELPEYVCFIHTHGGFPDKNIPEGITPVSKGRSSFLIFGNSNQFFKLGQNFSLNKALDYVAAYGFAKLYIVNKIDEQTVADAIKQKKFGFYSDTSDLDESFLETFVNLEKGFIEIETWMECRPDDKGGEWTYLKIFKANSLPTLPTILV